MSFCGVIVETAMNITFPTLMREFNITTSTVQWMTTIYMLVVASIVPLSAFLKRRFKTRSLFLCANLLFIAGLLLDLLAPIFPIMLLGRLVQGLGTGIALPLMFNIILEQVPASKIGVMMGIGTLITAIAPAIGPTFGGLVVTNMSWRYIFVFLLPLMVLSFILGVTCIQQKAPTEHVPADPLSIILIIVAFVGLIYGSSNIASASFISWPVLVPLIIGACALVLFGRRQLRVHSPIIDIRVLANARFSGHVLAFFLIQMTTLGMSFILPNYVQLVNGQTALTAGLLVLPGAALGALCAPFSGRILDRFGARIPIVTGGILATIALFIYVGLGKYISDLLITLVYVLYMLGIGISFGNIMTNALQQLDVQHQTTGNAILNTIQQFAGALGTALTSTVIASGQAGRSSAIGTAFGAHHAFFMLALIYACALLTILLITRKTKNAD
ncbi:DHA2 family efflux MFS transporter permease subunit [Lacticaseibacillus hulanensis]|uniref:DHA2 family efflux MFS transporter permease subunit n=1 Tax=Lacticaseibacillus hulanensis TaxID=2493111 RepID=UPI000FD8CC6F|nr:DHA2 family efflux MFS transporter permease subunit [Lacticaseibacillus hulanensis]